MGLLTRIKSEAEVKRKETIEQMNEARMKEVDGLEYVERSANGLIIVGKDKQEYIFSLVYKIAPHFAPIYLGRIVESNSPGVVLTDGNTIFIGKDFYKTPKEVCVKKVLKVGIGILLGHYLQITQSLPLGDDLYAKPLHHYLLKYLYNQIEDYYLYTDRDYMQIKFTNELASGIPTAPKYAGLDPIDFKEWTLLNNNMLDKIVCLGVKHARYISKDKVKVNLKCGVDNAAITLEVDLNKLKDLIAYQYKQEQLNNIQKLLQELQAENYKAKLSKELTENDTEELDLDLASLHQESHLSTENSHKDTQKNSDNQTVSWEKSNKKDENSTKSEHKKKSLDDILNGEDWLSKQDDTRMGDLVDKINEKLEQTNKETLKAWDKACDNIVATANRDLLKQLGKVLTKEELKQLLESVNDKNINLTPDEINDLADAMTHEEVENLFDLNPGDIRNAIESIVSQMSEDRFKEWQDDINATEDTSDYKHIANLLDQVEKDQLKKMLEPLIEQSNKDNFQKRVKQNKAGQPNNNTNQKLRQQGIQNNDTNGTSNEQQTEEMQSQTPDESLKDMAENISQEMSEMSSEFDEDSGDIAQSLSCNQQYSDYQALAQNTLELMKQSGNYSTTPFSNLLERNLTVTRNASRSWVKILEEVMQEYAPKQLYSYCPPNKRFIHLDILLPSKEANNRIHKVNWFDLYFDSSGSMTIQKVNLVASIIYKFSKLLPKKSTCWEFNSNLFQLKSVRGKIKEFPKRKGGTKIECFTNNTKKRDAGKVLRIICSDGGFNWRLLTDWIQNNPKEYLVIILTDNCTHKFKPYIHILKKHRNNVKIIFAVEDTSTNIIKGVKWND